MTVHEGMCDSSCESLSTDLTNLLKTGNYSDIVLNIGNKTINAHKCILASRSDVFDSMIDTDLTTIDIHDFAYDSVAIFVQYLYSSKLPSVTVELARDLAKLAGKYIVVELMNKCAAFLIANISRENVLDTLQFADCHGPTAAVKEKAIRFIIENQVILSDSWREFSENNLKLSNEVYRYFVEDRMTRVSQGPEENANRQNVMNSHILKKIPHNNEN